MLSSKPAAWCGRAGLLWLLSASALAETADPLDAAAPTAPLIYQPALHAYPPLPERPQQNWPEANRVVGEIGGWRVYANEPWEQPKTQSAAPVKQEGASHAHH
jgi:hypothetical protein